MSALTRQLFDFDVRNLRVKMSYYAGRVDIATKQKGAYISTLNCEITPEDRLALESLTDGELHIVAVTPEFAEEMGDLWQDFVKAVKASHDEVVARILAKQARQRLNMTHDPQAATDQAGANLVWVNPPEIDDESAKPEKKSKEPKGPHGMFWNPLCRPDSILNAPIFRDWIAGQRAVEGSPDDDVLRATFGVESRAQIEPELFIQRLRDELPDGVAKDGLLKQLERNAKNVRVANG